MSCLPFLSILQVLAWNFKKYRLTDTFGPLDIHSERIIRKLRCRCEMTLIKVLWAAVIDVSSLASDAGSRPFWTTSQQQTSSTTFSSSSSGDGGGGDWLTEQGLTSHQTHYRSHRGRFSQVIWPNQPCQSTEGNQLVFEIWLESHQDHSTVLQ